MPAVPTAAAASTVNAFVVAHVRHAPQHAVAAGASSVARLSTGSAFIFVLSSMG